MRITGVKSICCGKPVKTRRSLPFNDDRLYVCFGCGKPCDHYFLAEIERVELQYDIGNFPQEK